MRQSAAGMMVPTSWSWRLTTWRRSAAISRFRSLVFNTITPPHWQQFMSRRPFSQLNVLSSQHPQWRHSICNCNVPNKLVRSATGVTPFSIQNIRDLTNRVLLSDILTKRFSITCRREAALDPAKSATKCQVRCLTERRAKMNACSDGKLLKRAAFLSLKKASDL
jgi:hypothetical protein